MDPDLLRTLLNEQLGKELDLLSQRVKAEQDTANELRRKNDLEEQALRNAERSRQAEIQKVQLWLNISEQTANLVQQLPEFKLTILGMAEQLEELDEQRLKDIIKRLDRIENILILLLGNKKGNEVDIFIKGVQRDRLKNLLSEQYTLLHNLEMKKVEYCQQHNTLDIPLWMTSEIADTNLEISKLESDLRNL